MKSGTDDIHKLTEAVYKNLVENFNSGVRQILLTGKTYYKSLQAVSATALAYNDALSRVGSMAKICRGGTEEIGEAILQIAEAQREIQARLEDSTKALFTELILPLEQKLDKDFKKAHSDARKYSQSHKVVLSPYNKACETLKKFRKKTKNKFVYDNEKEAQHMRSLGKCQEKLDQYRIQGLKTALLEERRCHCFVLQRLCAISYLNMMGHRQGIEVYMSLPEWQDVSSNPHMLPPSAEQLIADFMQDEQYEPMNGGPGYHGNGFLHRDNRDTQSLGNEVRRSRSTQDIYRQTNHFDGTKTLPPRTAPPPPPGNIIQALYSFTAEVDNQLSFNEGDIINVMGEKSEGWQYGQNTASQRLGWFPLSFTKPVSSGRESPDFKQFSHMQRTKSVGDMLDSRSLSDYPHHYEHDIPGNVRRPKSLYDGPPGVASAPQAVGPLVPISTVYNTPPTSIYTHYPTPIPSQADCAPIYQHIPAYTETLQQLHGMHTRRDMSPQRAPSIYTSHGRPVQDTTQSTTAIYSDNQVPIPPPPNFGPPSTTSYAGQLHSRSRTLTSGGATGLPRMSGMTPPGFNHNHAPPPSHPPPQPPPPPPLPSNFPPAPNPPKGANPPKTGPNLTLQKQTNVPPPPPLPAPTAQSKASPVPTTSSLSALLSQQPSPQRNSRLSSSSSQGFGSPARQQPSQPPPPPPQRDQDDINTIEENVNYRNNPMFATVSLRQTKTNDRSAPKL